MKNVFVHSVLALSVAALLGACGAETPPDPSEMTAEAGCDPSQRIEWRNGRQALEATALDAALESRGGGSPAMWTLSDEDTTLYILGTVHLLRPELNWKSEEIEAAIASADKIVFEADTASLDAQRELIRFYTREGVFTDGTQLTSLLTAAEQAELAEALQTIEWPIEAVKPMRPWRAAVDISVKAMMDEGFDPNSGVEKVIERAAMERGAEFAFLETVEQQLGGLAGLDICEQVNFLMVTADSLGDGSATLDLLVEEWADGDVNGIGLMMANPEMIGSQAIYDVMITERNRLWVPQITAMLDEPGTVLIAVGAGHLAGEHSVVKLLRDEGYTVEGP